MKGYNISIFSFSVSSVAIAKKDIAGYYFFLQKTVHAHEDICIVRSIRTKTVYTLKIHQSKASGSKGLREAYHNLKITTKGMSEGEWSSLAHWIFII